MSALSGQQLRSAVAYNRARPYSKADWRKIQATIGAGADGVPGPGTAQKVAAFQKERGLEADGKVGAGTLEAMNVSSKGTHEVHAIADKNTFYFIADMQVDADGAPNAYHPDNIGLDFLANAGRPGNWFGIATDDRGEPYIQKEGKYAGYYISTTGFVNGKYKPDDARRYVDSSTIPYFVLPRNFKSLAPGADAMRKGDLGAVIYESDFMAGASVSQLVYAIYGDVGPTHTPEKNHLGEGSIALAKALGHNPLVNRRGHLRALRSITTELVYILFPGSGTGKHLSADEIDQRGQAALEERGGEELLATIRAELQHDH